MSVLGCELRLGGRLDEQGMAKSWPSSLTAMKVEAARVNITVEVSLSAEHKETMVLELEPQAGARISIGGSPEDAERWTSVLVMGEVTSFVSPSDALGLGGGTGGTSPSRPTGSAARGCYKYSCEQEPPSDDQNEESAADSDSDGGVAGVTGGGLGLTGLAGKSPGAVVLTGFGLRATVTLTATLYLAGQCDKLALLVNGTGTLGVRPRLLGLSQLSLPRLFAVATQDFDGGDAPGALHKWRQALPMQERLAREHGGKESGQLATLLHTMGVAHAALGSREALAYLRQALAIRQHLHGEEHPDTARTLQELGDVRVRDGEYHEAFEYFWQALRYYEAFEPECLDTAQTLQSLAGVYSKLGEYTESQECYLRALAIREQELGDEHLEVAATLHHLGLVFEKVANHREALDSLQRALFLREKLLGPADPQTARTLHSIGIVHSQLLDYNAALAFYQRALHICQVLPGESGHAAATLNNMGVVYAKMGDVEKAIAHHQRAAETQEVVLGPDHSDTRATRYNLHMLEIEQAESKRKRTAVDHLRVFLGSGCNGSGNGGDEWSAGPPSLVTLLCDESHEVDGPMDEPCCSYGRGCGSSTRAVLQQCGPSRQVGNQPPRTGFPQPRRRERAYPAVVDADIPSSGAGGRAAARHVRGEAGVSLPPLPPAQAPRAPSPAAAPAAKASGDSKFSL